MKIALCNEVLQPMPFARQCEWAAAVGYDGLEVAPFTLSDQPQVMIPQERAAVRRAAADAGIAITGLHWLLLTPKGLSITSPEAAVRARTVEVMLRLIDFCADVGGKVLVHGSPGQRAIAAGETRETAIARARDAFGQVAEHAQRAGMVYCIEPLATTETPVINTLAEAAAIVDAIGNPALRTMIDTSAAGRMEEAPLAAVIDRWLPTGRIAHVQVNDPNRRGPGEGELQFGPVFAALKRHGYAGVVAVEPFKHVPNGQACAARAIGYVRGILESLEGA
ncbi:MAG TPA: sugar phosphate isomerase/epimerase family protein [Burkholderiales bacterium]|nr:sugar phosphate isomerase/epimerase family protein [Burkholderiales bacterium]